MKHIFYTLVIVGLFFTSCSKKNNITPEPILTMTTPTFEGGWEGTLTDEFPLDTAGEKIINGGSLYLEITSQGQVSGDFVYIETTLTETTGASTQDTTYVTHIRSVQGNITYADTVTSNEIDFIAATGSFDDPPYLTLTGVLNDSTKTGEGVWVFPTNSTTYGSTEQFIITAKWELTKEE